MDGKTSDMHDDAREFVNAGFSSMNENDISEMKMLWLDER